MQKELDELRDRFGALKDVDRPAAQQDFVTIAMSAKVDGEEVDSADGLSYQVGAGNMLEGLDEALEGLSPSEDATFETTLMRRRALGRAGPGHSDPHCSQGARAARS